MEDDFVISQSKLSLLREYQPHISALFSVTLEVLPTAGNASGNCASQVWIRVKTLQQQQQDVSNAKEYILSLVSEDEASWMEKVLYSKAKFELLERNHKEIEINSRAVVSLRQDECSLQIHGQPMNIVLAKTYIDHLLQEYESSQTACSPSKAPSSFPNVDQAGFRSRGEVFTDRTNQSLNTPCLSPGADSCYGSSDDCIVDSNTFSCPPPPPPRTDRQAIIDPGNNSPPIESAPSPRSQSGSTSSSSPDPEQDKNYLAKLEFGLKLGYSLAQVNSVLSKLGMNAPQNELLSELISLGTSKTPVSIAEKDSSDPVSTAVDQSVPFSMKGLSSEPETTVSSGTDSDVSNRLSADSACSEDTDTAYRHIVIDGSNVAMSHGNKEVFSCQGIKLAVDWFRNRGCKDITVFVPQWRKESSRPDAPIKDQHILIELEKERILSFTPARRISGKRMVCYDDRYVLKLAAEVDGIVVSNDNYRDLLVERGDYKKVVEERLLMYSFVRDRFMPPDDPLGRHGPSLENFLRKEPTVPETMPAPCPYGKKCTYGNKCKYYHAERGNFPQISVTEKLKQQAKQNMEEMKERGKSSEEKKKGGKKRPLSRTDSSSAQISKELVPPPRPPRKPVTPPPRASPQRDILETDVRENDADFKAYNDKLSELSKNIPIDNSYNVQEILGASSKKLEMSGHSVFLEPGPWPVGDKSKARSSPQLVTGHLDLAKTLSDEANREQRQKSLRQQQEELKRDLRRNPNLPVYTPQQDEADQLRHAVDQLSFNSAEVPHIQAQSSHFSSDPVTGQFYSSEPLHSTGPEGHFGGQVLLSGEQQFLSDREGLSSVYRGSPQTGISGRPPGPSNMNRQNSTSDPGLDKHSVSSSYTPYPNQVFNQRTTSHSPSFQNPQFIAGPFTRPSVPSNFTRQNYYPPGAQPHPALGPGAGAMAPGGWGPQSSSHIPESGYPPDTPILPTDTRYSLYYHLCGLFPEHHVRHVMNRFPKETNPRNLCFFLLDLKG